MAASEDGGDPGYDGSNTTGFVSPASDALEGTVDLAALLDLRRPHRYTTHAGEIMQATAL